MVTSVSVSISSCHSAGCPCISALLRAKSLVGRPSMRYEATVNGAPAKPSTAVRPSSSPADQPDGLEEVGGGLLGVDDAQRAHGGGVAHRLVDDRARARGRC